jgi:hypothetical protein
MGTNMVVGMGIKQKPLGGLNMNKFYPVGYRNGYGYGYGYRYGDGYGYGNGYGGGTVEANRRLRNG